MTKFLFWMAVSWGFLFASACVTQASKDGSVAQNNEKSEKECRSFGEVGSRIRRNSTCLTKEEWAVIDARQKEVDAGNDRDNNKFFRESIQKSGQVSGSGLDNPNTPSP